MTTRYRTLPQVKFKEFRDLERRRVEASDTVWALLVGSRLAVQTLAAIPDQRSLLADEFPNLAHVQRMNQRLDRTARLIVESEGTACTMAMNFTFGLHEDFVRSCLRLLVSLGKATNGDAATNSDKMHEVFSERTGHVADPDSLALFHLTRKVRNAFTHAAGLVRQDLVDHYATLSSTAQATWSELTSEEFRIPRVGEPAAFGVSGLIGALAVQKRLAYDVNLGLQLAVPRDAWADMAVNEYFAESGKSVKDPSARRSVIGYLRGGFGALNLSAAEIQAGIERKKKSGML
ncbi:hypothetical protein GCM10025867_08530 [Frondihabitans sucicola]|uniref:Uncharacterized protein n=1 Tax=Frondihabitans sucicola TaxID=1268041 RepID=A0ABM8GJN1_9MICO|nr:hypothetical protein [Frondihabitans sucicola]BDZ48612.1 hypothetical protein GCM10025867_08530 [Frondihabitans sucicola]